MKEKSKKTIPGLPGKRSPYSIAAPYILCVLFAYLLSGCATVDPKPFADFHKGVLEIKTIDSTVDTHVASVKTSELSKIDVTKFGLNFTSDDPFAYTSKITEVKPEPLFIKLERFDSGLTEINEAFIEYAGLLATLAGDELLNVAEFDAMAKDLNNNVAGALTKLGKGTDGVALFSVAATNVAYQYISKKRKEYLQTIISENQVSVETFVKFAREGVATLANDIKANYVEEKRDLFDKMAAKPSSEKKKILTYKIYYTSVALSNNLDLLRALDKTYSTFSVTHENLGVGIEKNNFSTAQLVASIKRVQKLYKELEKTNIEAEKALAAAAKSK